MSKTKAAKKTTRKKKTVKKKTVKRAAQLEMGTDGKIRDISNESLGKLRLTPLSEEARFALDQMLRDYSPGNIIHGIVELCRKELKRGGGGNAWMSDPEWADKMRVRENFIDVFSKLLQCDMLNDIRIEEVSV